MKIRLAVSEIQRDSIVDGEGIRAVIWTQGCPHNCPGCHNPSTHSFDGGVLVDIDDVKKQIDDLSNQSGITFSGGDPMMQPRECYEIAKYAFKKDLNIWCYTGFTYEEVLKMAKHNEYVMKFLKLIDVLVDGKFVISKKSYDCVFRGSKNQRLIDVKKSLSDNRTVLITKYDKVEVNRKGRKNNYMFI